MRAGIAQSAVVEVWPENWQALEIFSALQTQWRISMAGPTGLDYAVLPAVMELQHIAAPDRPGLFASLQVMESEALKVFAERHRSSNGR